MKNIAGKPPRSQPAPRSGKSAVCLVDDHAVVRQGMAELINKQPDLAVCGESDSVADALSVVARSKPDIILVDITLKNSDGLELIRALHLQQPSLPVLVVSMHEESLHAESALRAGARGYIMKDQAILNVLSAIRRVLAGRIYLSEEMTSRLLQSKLSGTAGTSGLGSLSERELQVFRMIGQWYQTSKIADQLHISVKTVEYYREKIKEKLGLRSGVDLKQYATQWMDRHDS